MLTIADDKTSCCPIIKYHIRDCSIKFTAICNLFCTVTETEMSKLLSETKSTTPDALWVEKCRGAFYRVLTTKPEATKGNSE